MRALTIDWFTDIWHELGCTSDPRQAWSLLRKLYGQGFRDYHDWKHPTALIGILDDVRARADSYPKVAFALLGHDAVMVLSRDKDADSLNVQRSAELCVTLLRVGGAAIWVREKVEANVMATSRPNVPLIGDPALTADIDMCILGQEWPVYKQYMAGVEAEYRFGGMLTEAEWLLGRSEFLFGVLKTQLFRTDYFIGQYQDRAEENIQREIEILKGRVRTQ